MLQLIFDCNKLLNYYKVDSEAVITHENDCIFSSLQAAFLIQQAKILPHPFY
jgi:hypothetical protein